MKNLFTNLILFIALSIAFSSFTACNTATTQKGPVLDDAPNNSNTANANTDTAKTSKYPPAPSGIMQADIKDIDGNTFKLEDKKGKVILVNLWAIWCGPCITEMPHLREMQEKYKDKNFEVIGLNTGNEDYETESNEKIKIFAEKQKLNYQLGHSDEKMTGEFIKLSRQSGIPQSVLINREGKTTGIFFGAGSRVINSMKEAVDKTVNE